MKSSKWARRQTLAKRILFSVAVFFLALFIGLPYLQTPSDPNDSLGSTYNRLRLISASVVALHEKDIALSGINNLEELLALAVAEECAEPGDDQRLLRDGWGKQFEFATMQYRGGTAVIISSMGIPAQNADSDQPNIPFVRILLPEGSPAIAKCYDVE